MSSYQRSHHLEGWAETSFTLQMGQADHAAQRQQTDELSHFHDGHGVERELQFCDLGFCEAQLMG